MKIRIWNAFASNNSGSYTIVGAFDSPERAVAVAAVVREMVEKHSAWLEQGRAGDLGDEDSPLAAFARLHGLTWEKGRGTCDDWPEHGETNVPEVVAHGHQVLVHVDYTVSMPPTIGEFFYKRGGRVAIELNHAHGPIVATVTAWWPWKDRDQKKVDEAVIGVVDELTGEGGALLRLASPWHPAAWSPNPEFEGDLTLACVFDDLCAGYREVGDVILRHGGSVQLQVAELHRGMEPFAALRPCSPPSKTPRYDLWLGEPPSKGSQVRGHLAAVLDVGSWQIDRMLEAAPGVILEAMFEPSAKRMAAVLETHRVDFELRGAK